MSLCVYRWLGLEKWLLALQVTEQSSSPLLLSFGALQEGSAGWNNWVVLVCIPHEEMDLVVSQLPSLEILGH